MYFIICSPCTIRLRSVNFPSWWIFSYFCSNVLFSLSWRIRCYLQTKHTKRGMSLRNNILRTGESFSFHLM